MSLDEHEQEQEHEHEHKHRLESTSKSSIGAACEREGIVRERGMKTGTS